MFRKLAILMILVTMSSQAMSRRTMIHDDPISHKHDRWMAQHGRSYHDHVEKARRFEIFKENWEFVESFNNAGNRSYKLGMNEFADLTNDEFFNSRNGFKMFMSSKMSSSEYVKTSFRYRNVSEVPESLDWREKGAVTPVKDQGRCGCCWAFSAVAAIEGITTIKNGKLISLSEQQILDCDVNGNNNGCEGGWMGDAFDYIVKNQGITTEANYPYQEAQATCNGKKTESYQAARISGYEDVPSNDEESLLKALTRQPVSVAIEGSGSNFKLYSSGIFNEGCGTSLDHAVTIVGYGTSDDGTKYWLIKNSWGESWGENGYMKIQRDVDQPQGVCGLAMKACYPVA